MSMVEIDHQLLQLINTQWCCKPLDRFFVELTVLGAWPVILIALAVLSHRDRRTFWRHALVLLCIGMLVVFPVRRQLKRVIDRERPVTTMLNEHGLALRMLEPKAGSRRSFPSGHTVMAFYTLTYAALARRRLAPALLLLAVAIGYSRVYVGAHYPGDCLAGALLGAAGAYLAWRVFVWLEKRAERSKT
jgi:undecaprenyl-diphosphatase